jgi:ERCC4-type nuclease
MAAELPVLTVDYREKDLISLLGDSAEVKSLPVGDIWIGIREVHTGGLLIERKTICDLEASILDGRYREQRGRILAFCQERGAQPMYVLEGSGYHATGRLAPSALRKFVNRLALHYQIPVFRTNSVDETAEWVKGLVEQWKEDPTALQRTTELVKVSDGIHVQKKANAADPRQFLIQCLAQCPGVSVKIAEQLADTYPSWESMMSATKEGIQEVKVGARRVGPAVAQRLYDLLH